ncbi:MAG: hypothetical protein CMO34_01795 [Verrucomicrobia bacterium]|nr:hypothetical protein [Verrucomicrobiota bacterium]|tara:strand:- start:148 stop:342 length:195 start_codon:yes stop_codon:yes gene_type:complete
MIHANFAKVEGFSISNKYEKEDYYLSVDGYIIFTEKYHLKRGYCCRNGCKHCPFGFHEKQKTKR